MEKAFEEIVRQVERYGVGFDKDGKGDLIGQFSLEFLEKDYANVVGGMDEEYHLPFFKSFVKLRVRRERTIKTRLAERMATVEMDRIASESMDPEEQLIREETKREMRAQVVELYKKLNKREREVVKLLMTGASKRRDIAERMQLSLGTVQGVIQGLRDNPTMKALWQLARGGTDEASFLPAGH